MLSERITPHGIEFGKFKDAQIHLSPPQDFVNQSLDLLDELVTINTFTKNIAGINKGQDIFEREMKAIGLLVERIPGVAGKSGDILIGKTPAAAKSNSYTLLLGHIDTVYPEHLVRPVPERMDGRYLAPGSVDMKAGLIVVLAALQALHAEGTLYDIPLAFAINADEEIGSPYSRPFFSKIAPAVKEALVFEGGRTDDVIVTARRGIMAYRVHVTGRSAHAGSSHKKGVNAIAHAARFILDIEALTDYDQNVTANVGVVSGGKTFNAVPDYAQFEFEVRCNSDSHFKDIVRKITTLEKEYQSKAGVSVKLEELAFSPPMPETDESRSLAERFIAAGETVGIHQRIHQGPVAGTSDANLLSALSIPTIDGLGPFGSFAHNEAEEFFAIDSMGPKILALAQFLSSSNKD